MEKSSSQGGVLYRIRWRGQISGPFALDQVVQLVRGGKLSRHHEISADGQNWRTLEKSGMMGQPAVLSRPAEAESDETGYPRPASGATPKPALRQAAGAPELADSGVAGYHSSIASSAMPDAPVFASNSPLALSAQRLRTRAYTVC